MHYFRYDSLIKDVLDRPIQIPHPDYDIQKAAEVEARAVGLTEWATPMVDATFEHLLCWFLNRPYHDKDEKGKPVNGNPDAESLGRRVTVIRAIRSRSKATDGVEYFALEEGDNTWLLDYLKLEGPAGLKMYLPLVQERFTKKEWLLTDAEVAGGNKVPEVSVNHNKEKVTA